MAKFASFSKSLALRKNSDIFLHGIYLMIRRAKLKQTFQFALYVAENSHLFQYATHTNHTNATDNQPFWFNCSLPCPINSLIIVIEKWRRESKTFLMPACAVCKKVKFKRPPQHCRRHTILNDLIFQGNNYRCYF